MDGVGHASALGLVRCPVAISGLLRWSPSGTYRCCCMRDRYCAERSLTMHTFRIARSSAHLRVPIDQARSPMPRNLLLPAPHARLSAPLLHRIIFALHLAFPFYLGRKITMHQKVCTILLYLNRAEIINRKRKLVAQNISNHLVSLLTT